MILNREKVIALGGSMQKSRGFTLIELMVTIAVLAIIAMMAAPSFQSLIQANELKKATDNILFNLNEAKNNARLTGQTSVLKLDSSYSVPASAKSYSSYDLGKKASLVASDQAISFLATGLIQTTAKSYPVCIKVKHNVSLKFEYITVTQLGLITRSKTEC